MSKELVQATYFMDFEDSTVRNFIDHNCSTDKPKEAKAVELYYAVRDQVRYDPYTYSLDKHSFKASSILNAGRAWCVPKAILFATCCRALGLPTRLGFADVKNHLSTERMRTSMKTDVFHWHGYASILIHNKWVKATPSFNSTLCMLLEVDPLEFDGENDSIFQQYSPDGTDFM